MFKDIVKPAIVLFLICFVITGLLAIVDGVTKPIIIEGKAKAKQEALSKVLPGATEFSSGKSRDTLLSEGFKPKDGVLNLYEAKANGEDAGYVVEVASRGYAGKVKMLVGLDLDMALTGVVITEHNETPGLGSKAAEPDFLNQYLGALPEGGFRVVKTAASKDGDISAISGATITSRAVTNGISDATALVKEMKEGGK